MGVDVAADRGANNPLRLPLFLAAQQTRSLSCFGGSATEIALGAAASDASQCREAQPRRPRNRNVWCVALEMKKQFKITSRLVP